MRESERQIADFILLVLDSATTNPFDGRGYFLAWTGYLRLRYPMLE